MTSFVLGRKVIFLRLSLKFGVMAKLSKIAFRKTNICWTDNIWYRLSTSESQKWRYCYH